MVTIKPMLDKVVVQVQKTNDTGRGGIILAGKSDDETLIATVYARGPGGEVDSRPVKMYVNGGDHVLIPKNAGTKVKLDGQEFIILSQQEILAIVG